MKRVLIIAEAGVNHNGDIAIAKKLVDKAADCNVDIVKFQTIRLEALVSKNAATAEYQKKNTGVEESQFDMLKRLVLPFEAFKELENYCKKKGVMFLSTPFDLESINFLNGLDMPFWKIPSGEITNLPYLNRIAQTGKPVIMSTGMSTLDEIRFAVNILRENGTKDIRLLHCTTEYPAPFTDVNLRAMATMRDTFRLPVGYSDHTVGSEVAIAAVAMGAEIIEKHFTLDKNMEGPDHKASVEPDELRILVKSIRNVETAMGNGVKMPSSSELKNITIARKSIVAKCDIRKGEKLAECNITVKRPGDGISPIHWFKVLGTVACRDFEEDENIEI